MKTHLLLTAFLSALLGGGFAIAWLAGPLIKAITSSYSQSEWQKISAYYSWGKLTFALYGLFLIFLFGIFQDSIFNYFWDQTFPKNSENLVKNTIYYFCFFVLARWLAHH